MFFTVLKFNNRNFFITKHSPLCRARSATNFPYTSATISTYDWWGVKKIWKKVTKENWKQKKVIQLCSGFGEKILGMRRRIWRKGILLVNEANKFSLFDRICRYVRLMSGWSLLIFCCISAFFILTSVSLFLYVSNLQQKFFEWSFNGFDFKHKR